MGQCQRTFPETVWTIEMQVAEGDTVSNRFTWSATHTEDMDVLLATGRHITVSVIAFDRFRDGRLAKTRQHRDNSG
jgi:predicted ester cyclase